MDRHGDKTMQEKESFGGRELEVLLSHNGGSLKVRCALSPKVYSVPTFVMQLTTRARLSGVLRQPDG